MNYFFLNAAYVCLSYVETKVKIGVSVRGRDVYIIQSGLG